MKNFKKIVVEGSIGFINFDQKKFEEISNEHYQNTDLHDGYAPFCKHMFIENFTDGKENVVEITPDNEHLLKSCYEARTEKELPVLRRYFPKESVTVEKAKYLDLILYTKEQIQKENEAMNSTDPNKDVDYDFGIISIKLQNEPKDAPMDPITMMRNALGKAEGGSGVPLEREKYLESVKYWEKRAVVK